MSSSILDNLQVIQDIDDPVTNLDPQHYLQSHDEKLSQLRYPDLDHNMKVSCSTKPSQLMMSSWSQKSRSMLTRVSVPSRRSITHENGHDGLEQAEENCRELKILTGDDKFLCQSCAHGPEPSCEICHEHKQLNGNDNIVKFFEFVLEFKLGKRQSYKPKEQKLTSKRNTPNEHCNIYYSTINPKIQNSAVLEDDVRFSISNDYQRIVSRTQHEQKIKNCKQLHLNYNCDECEINPIIGPRYHCQICEDFDLCEQCFFRKGHRHDLTKIQTKNNQKALEKISTLLKVTNQGPLRSSIRNSQAIRNSMSAKGCKSWIR